MIPKENEREMPNWMEERQKKGSYSEGEKIKKQIEKIITRARDKLEPCNRNEERREMEKHW